MSFELVVLHPISRSSTHVWKGGAVYRDTTHAQPIRTCVELRETGHRRLLLELGELATNLPAASEIRHVAKHFLPYQEGSTSCAWPSKGRDPRAPSQGEPLNSTRTVPDTWLSPNLKPTQTRKVCSAFLSKLCQKYDRWYQCKITDA